MIGSRIHERRVQMTCSVKLKTLTAGQNVETNLTTGLIATREQPDASELFTDAGALVVVTDVFWFEPVSGTLPAITEKHTVIDASNNRYEVVMVQNQGGEGNRLKVMTRALR